MSPKAVVFMATDILADNRSAFSAGLAFATAVNASINPIMVPSRPSSVAMFENNATYGVRFSSCGMISIIVSSIAISISSRRRTAPCNSSPVFNSRLTVDLFSSVIFLAVSKSPFASTGCSLSHIPRLALRTIVNFR